MDTIETQVSPVEEAGATASPDTESYDTQTAEPDDSVSDGQSEEAGQAPELLAGKYKTPQELEKAYQELHSKLGEVGRKAEIANLIEKQTGMNADRIKEVLSQQERDQQQRMVQENPGLYSLQKVQALEEQLAIQSEERELDKFLSSEEGKVYQEFREDIRDFAFMPKYHGKSYAEIASEKFGRAIAQGQQGAYKKIEQKIGTQATGVSQSSPKTRLTPEDMDKMTAAELEAILPHADISNRPY